MGKHFSCFKNKKYIFAITFVSTVQADFVYVEHELFEISLGALKLQSIVHITGDDQILYKYVLNRQSIFFYMTRYHSHRITVDSGLKTS